MKAQGKKLEAALKKDTKAAADAAARAGPSLVAFAFLCSTLHCSLAIEAIHV